jgi:hypothetical protein
MSAALAIIDDWNSEPLPLRPAPRARLYLASSRHDDGSIATYDQFGNVTHFADAGDTGSFNAGFDSVTPTVTGYDVMDRTVMTTLPDTTTTSMVYGIGSGGTRFTTTVTDANGKQKESYRDVRELITAVKESNNILK